jgi:hypothetical protein
VLNADESTVEDSIWQKHEHVHRRLLFLENERNQVRQSIKDAEIKMIDIIEKKNFSVNMEDLAEVDKIASTLESKWHQRYQNDPFNYLAKSLYGFYWKRMNRLDGFK